MPSCSLRLQSTYLVCPHHKLKHVSHTFHDALHRSAQRLKINGERPRYTTFPKENSSMFFLVRGSDWLRGAARLWTSSKLTCYSFRKSASLVPSTAQMGATTSWFSLSVFDVITFCLSWFILAIICCDLQTPSAACAVLQVLFPHYSLRVVH